MIRDEALKQMGTMARSSSTRAYTGHSASHRHIFDLKNVNLTEFARSFGLYKQVYVHRPRKDLDPADRVRVKEEKEAAKETEKVFSKRLKKSKIKELERQQMGASGEEREKLFWKIKDVKREVYTDEKKIEQRARGFAKAQKIATMKKT